MVQETHLKLIRSKACKIRNYTQLRIDIQDAPKGGTTLYYNRSLYCCPIDITPLTNIEATACRLSSRPWYSDLSISLPPFNERIASERLKILFALGDAVILFDDFSSKNTNWNCNYSNRNGREMLDLAGDVHFNIVAPPTPTHYPFNDKRRPDVLDIALMKGVALRLSCIETLQCLNSVHRPVLMRLGSLTEDCPPLNKTITNWQKVSTVLEESDTPILNNILNDIVSTDDIDYAIGAFTNHIRTVVDNSSRTVPANSDRKELPRDVSELIRAKYAALRRADKYPTCENKSHARAL
ncbi:RNA-directed DNA polymerase from mobile element jockey [Eumeta japonica]|uniref:RNA-directed DNA polymerase from mobile element jockey n=1 Tax=Eumeta variegata TaxID=151549 RepID=A0A4C1XIG5_EUMVA|nr:RNA-directed DNA polymerase from mobile element jockey [Eumeta japonica]